MDRYDVDVRLGDGTYGSVWKATKKQTSEVVAIKTLKKKFHKWSECVNLRELESLSKIPKSPFIVELKELIREGDSQLHFVFEYMPDGNLYQLIKRCSANRTNGIYEAHADLSPQRVQTILFQVLSGLSHMHSHGFIHRDIKPENLLIQGNTCKIADFGLTRQNRSHSNETALTEYISTRWYRAPEVLLRDPNYSVSIDIFAVGCVMAEMISLNPLFPGNTEIDQIHRILKILGFPNNENWPEGIELVERMDLRIHSDEAHMSQLPNTHLYRTRLAFNHLFPNTPAETVSLMQKLLTLDPKKRPPARFNLHDEFFDAKLSTSDNITTHYLSGKRTRSLEGASTGILTPCLEIEKSQNQVKLMQNKYPPAVSSNGASLISVFEQSSAEDSCQAFPMHNFLPRPAGPCDPQGPVGQHYLPSFSNEVASSTIQNTEAPCVPIFRHRNGLQHTGPMGVRQTSFPIERNHFERNPGEYNV